MKYYLTAAIPYVNAKPHLGHALEFIQADVVARYHKALGEDVFFVSGADENSLKNVQAAEQAGISVQELCDKNTEAFIALAAALHIGFSGFMRSSSDEHIRSSQELWERCDNAGDIYKKAYRGLYCVGCEAFYTKDELSEAGECFEHPGKKLEEVEEENYFFRLSKYQSRLEALIRADGYRILPEGRKKEALEFIKRGLEDFSISRSKARSHGWGVPVPKDPTQIMYVWFDALNVYRSAARDRWPADLHIIGKGILRFHAVYWPAILLSAGIPLPKELFVHGYVTADGQKMSKTVGNVVDPMDLISRYGADAVRYYFLREIPPYDDGDFSEKKFKDRYNADLANGLGNLVSRTLKMAADYRVRLEVDKGYAESVLRMNSDTYAKCLRAYDFQKAIELVWWQIGACDAYIDRTQPFKVAKTDRDTAGEYVKKVLADLYLIGLWLRPFLPGTSEVILASIEQGAVSQPLFPRVS